MVKTEPPHLIHLQECRNYIHVQFACLPGAHISDDCKAKGLSQKRTTIPNQKFKKKRMPHRLLHLCATFQSNRTKNNYFGQAQSLPVTKILKCHILYIYIYIRICMHIYSPLRDSLK